MKWKNAAGAVVVFAAVMITGGHTYTIESAPFSFPAEVGVKIPVSTPSTAMYFKYSVSASPAGLLTFTWSFLGQAAHQRGTITVYSLSGRAVKTFPVSTNAGSVTWHAPGQSVKGVYIARIICGSARQTIKLLLCR